MTRIRTSTLVAGVLLLAAALTPAAVTASAAPSEKPRVTAEAKEERAAALEKQLRRSLGAAFGGAYLDAATGRLVVGVTDANLRSTIRAAGAEATVVRYTQRQLDAVKAKLDRLPPAPGVTGWYVDVFGNEVVVQVDDARAAPRTAAYLAQVRAMSPAVRVENVPESPRALHSVRGGYAWTTLLTRCTVGYSAVGAGGSKHFLTAGHCTQGIGPAFGHRGETMGSLGGSTFGMAGDYGKVNVRSNWRLYGMISKPGPDRAVKGSKVAPIGSTVCRAGSTTKWKCGRVTARNQTVVYINGGIVGGLTRTTACSEPGDSGGPFMWGYQAQGMTSGGSGDCSSGGVTYFQPVREALSAYKLRLVTG